ncbi:hypothetical protein JNW91_02845 [Micromonospora sp. STR1_7]|uniref:DUF4436 domain-containing protein n=1 Tax=Micromonospora parastrephiae TaxID=2806101 RepID=A0ABS1XNQ8_9ACTN|nr:hypothetical protein [Micromonospora parastrephiae]MBM0230903.1 hypothetical protein [Micromonospora parastrephiae]
MPASDTSVARRFGRTLSRRLGRPAGGTGVAWAALGAVICGLFTGALASRVAWETSRPQPDRAEAGAILTEVFPGHDLGDIDTPPALFVVYAHPVRLGTVKTLLLGDGGEYQESATGAAAFGAPPVPAEQIVAVARDRLRSSGWRVYDPQESGGTTCTDKVCATPVAVTDTAMIARRGDTILNAMISSQAAVDATYLTVEVHRAPPPAVVPAGVLGTLLGAVVAWAVFGWASRRTAGRRSGGTVNVLIGVAMVLWWLPVLLTVPLLLRHHLDEPHPAWHPLWEWLGQPTASLLFLVGALCVLLALGVAAGTRRGTSTAL